jgi:Asp-tRNA(Asn)/Glu-tRNA(Gln) amidotransferase A subunit family amidase
MLRELADAVRTDQVEPRELVEQSLRRIDAVNDILNAVIARRDDDALAEADALSDERRAGPLAGLPVLVKDLHRVAGLPTTYGSPLYADGPPEPSDDSVVARLRAAGAIVVGKTNTPAFGHTAFTDNELFGPTRNPWNPDRTPGGSSGGSAASLAAGMAPLATTTDGGGSVRIPAALCGLVGYKPTIGVVGREGAPRWMAFSATGATGRTVADAMLEATVLAGPTGQDVLELPAGSVPIEAVRPSRVIACRTLRTGVDPAVGEAFDAMVAAIGDDVGLPVDIIERPFTATDLPFRWFLISAAEIAQSLAWCRHRWDSFEPAFVPMLRFGDDVSIGDYLAAQRLRYDAAAELESLLAGEAVLVTPTCNVPAWGPSGPLPDTAGGVTDPAIAVNTVEFNFIGNPAVSVPMGLDPSGVPMGLQIVAPRFADKLALGLAAALEQARPWPTVAAGYEPFPLP